MQPQLRIIIIILPIDLDSSLLRIVKNLYYQVDTTNMPYNNLQNFQPKEKIPLTDPLKKKLFLLTKI